jgi:hypothetical protein
MMSAEDILSIEPDSVIKTNCFMIDVTRTMLIVELTYGVIVQTTFTDEEGITLTETLFSNKNDRKTFTLIGRWRNGGTHHSMRSYGRDNKFPLRCRVKL